MQDALIYLVIYLFFFEKSEITSKCIYVLQMQLCRDSFNLWFMMSPEVMILK